MNPLGYALLNVVETLLRVFPIPCKTGLVRVGNPGRDSPVFLTCNYHLTVERVKRALDGMDAYLLVANSRGINVWCAATGGLLTNHGVISVLKTSGIEEHVDHRRVILPQLAATGVEARVVRKKTGWRVIWGPVRVRDVPLFVAQGFTKTREMRRVGFPWVQRIEMAAAWAFPISGIASLIFVPLWREAIFPLVGIIWGLSFLIFMAFPFYSRWLKPKGKRIGFIFFDFGQWGIQLIFLGALAGGIVGYGALAGDLSWGFVFRWCLISLMVVLVLSLDLMGSTPLYKSGLHEDRLLTVRLDREKCKGAGICEQVCPRDCYELDRRRHLAAMPRAGQCVQCGACIVQCPFDALCFQSPGGEIIPPETIRRSKLNLLGKRLVRRDLP